MNGFDIADRWGWMIVAVFVTAIVCQWSLRSVFGAVAHVVESVAHFVSRSRKENN